jgi:acyl-CoA thioester hydrolase
VRYPETDAQAVVYHANFLVYCDVARVEYFRKMAGEGGREAWARAHNFDIVLVNANCDFRASARFDDLLTVGMRLDRVGTSSFTFAYRISRGDVLVCEARTVHVTIDRHSRETRPLPDELKQALTAFEAALEATA